MDLNVVPEPKSCKDCAASCPDFKVKGCPFDIANQAIETRNALRQLGISMPGLEQGIAALSTKAGECRREIIGKIAVHNQGLQMAARLAPMVAKMMQQSQPGETLRLPIKVVAKAPPILKETLDEPNEADDGDEGKGELAAPTSQGDERRSRGNAELYADPADEGREADYLAMQGVHGLCTTPKVKIAKAKGVIEQMMGIFQQAPFEGFVGAIIKHHAPGSELGRITVYYRGPAPGKATAAFREAWQKKKQGAAIVEPVTA